jgi:hypothetical protein
VTNGGKTGVGLSLGLVIAAAAAVVPACGSSGDASAASCGAVQPCGGSLIGTWTVQAACQPVEDFTFDMECPGATLDQSAHITSGSLTFNADMTVMTSFSLSGRLRVTAPLSCLALATCDEYASFFSPGPPDATTTCTTVGGNTCDCTLVRSMPQSGSGSGTYTTAGYTLNWTLPGAPSSSYCVQGNTLHLMDVDPTTGEITRDMIATK